MYHRFFIHSSVDGHLGCFHVLVIVNSAAMNVGVHVSFLILVSSGYMPGSGIIGSYGSFILVFKGISILFSIVAVSLQFFQRTFCEIIDFKMGALEAKKRLISPPDRAGPPQAHSGRLNDGRFSGKLL